MTGTYRTSLDLWYVTTLQVLCAVSSFLFLSFSCPCKSWPTYISNSNQHLVGYMMQHGTLALLPILAKSQEEPLSSPLLLELLLGVAWECATTLLLAVAKSVDLWTASSTMLGSDFASFIPTPSNSCCLKTSWSRPNSCFLMESNASSSLSNCTPYRICA